MRIKPKILKLGGSVITRKDRGVLGFAKTHQAMVKLDKLIVDALIDEGVSAVAIPPSACIEGG